MGGVWYHNRYPGARVDIESYFYCFPEEDLYPQWSWKERYPAQPEILAYLNFAADTWGIRPYIRFSTWVTGAQWEPDSNRYRVTASNGESVTARYLIMAGGQLSKAKTPVFRGLEDFRGRWVQTAHWPTDHVETAGKRIAVIGTGSSGVQVVPALARDAANVTVFHRTANYSVPAQNGPLDQQKYSNYASRIGEMRETILHHPVGSDIPLGAGPASSFSPDEQQALLRGALGPRRAHDERGLHRPGHRHPRQHPRCGLRPGTRAGYRAGPGQSRDTHAACLSHRHSPPVRRHRLLRGIQSKQRRSDRPQPRPHRPNHRKRHPNPRPRPRV